MKKLFALLLIFSFIGCASQSKTVTVNDEFSNPNAPITRKMSGNFLFSTVDILHMIPASELNGFVSRDRKTDEIVRLGFNLVNVENSRRWLTIRKGDEMVILADGERIALKSAYNTSLDHTKPKYNSMTNSIETYYYDFATYYCTKEQFRKIANSKTLKIRIYGENGVTELGVKGTVPMNPHFIKNLNEFYNNEIDIK